jgi:hypothetical protein
VNPGDQVGSNPEDRPRWEEPCGRSGRLTPLCAMLDELKRSALAELERTLRVELAPYESPAERRWRRLGFLARLLKGEFPSLLGYPDIERKRYDELKPEAAPRSARLVEEFGSWKKACKAGLRASARRPRHLSGPSLGSDTDRCSEAIRLHLGGSLCCDQAVREGVGARVSEFLYVSALGLEEAADRSRGRALGTDTGCHHRVPDA